MPKSSRGCFTLPTVAFFVLCILDLVNAQCSSSNEIYLNTTSNNAAGCFCRSGYYRHAVALDCRLCQASFYCPGNELQSQMLACPANMTSAVGANSSAACSCLSSFRLVGSQCVLQHGQCSLCPRGSFCSDNLQTSCPPNSDTLYAGARNVSECFCKPSYYGMGGNSTCQICPVGSVCPGYASNLISVCDSRAGAATSPVGSSGFGNCSCLSGWYNNGSSVCTLCDADYYCPGAPAPNSAAVKIFCGNNKRSIAGSDSVQDCTCRPGMAGETVNNFCYGCDPGLYCPGDRAKIRYACFYVFCDFRLTSVLTSCSCFSM
jgi:hypothetical protein